MAGDPTKVNVWETGDLFIFDNATPFVPATHIPADVNTALNAAWKPAGLMLGDPGVQLPRSIDETDINAWQLKRFRTKFRNGKVDGNATLLEENTVTEDLLDPDMQPHQVSRYVAMEFLDSDTNYVKRRFTKAKANLFVENDTHSETPTGGRPVRMRFYPDATGKVFTTVKGTKT